MHHDELEKKQEHHTSEGCSCETECKCGCKDGKCNCGCGCGCCCGGSKFLVKLLAALVLFLAGYGFAHLDCCGCKAKRHMRYPHHHASMVKHMENPGFADGSNHIIVITADGEAQVAPRPQEEPVEENKPEVSAPAENASGDAPVATETPAEQASETASE